jgi:hypothetical protein
MGLDQLSAIAELVAAMAVVASLLFLGYELREGNRQARLSNWRELLEALRSFKAQTNDLAFAEMIERAGRDYAGLAAHEKIAYGMYLEQGIHVYGNFAKHTGRIPPGYVGLDEAIENSLRDMLTTSGARAWWDEARGRKRMMAATISRIDRIMAETPPVSNAPAIRLGAPGKPVGRRL